MIALKLAIWVALLGGLAWFYIFRLRPWLAEQPWAKESYTEANTFWQDVGVRLKTWWGTALTILALVGAQIPDLIVNLQDVDFTVLGMSLATAKVVAQGIAIVGLVVRFTMASKKQE